MVSWRRQRGRHRAEPISRRRWIPVAATIAALLVAGGVVIGLSNGLAGSAPADAANQNAGGSAQDARSSAAAARSRAEAPERQAGSGAAASSPSSGTAEASTGTGAAFGDGGSSGFVPPTCPDTTATGATVTPADPACDIAPGYPGG